MARISCVIPFCGKSTGLPGDEWICGSHWRFALAVGIAGGSKGFEPGARLVPSGRDRAAVPAPGSDLAADQDKGDRGGGGNWLTVGGLG
jgi:hypothetical protein